MRSSVNGTLGSSVIIERVRKSSGRIVGAAKFESAVAADLRARSDAVRLDLNADLGFGVGVSSSLFSGSGLVKARKSSSSTSMGSDSGWSVTISRGGELAGSCLRADDVTRRRARKEGVSGKPGDGEASPEELSMSEGVESEDMVVDVMYDGEPVSLSTSSSSSGGLRSKSRGLRSIEELYSFSEL